MVNQLYFIFQPCILSLGLEFHILPSLAVCAVSEGTKGCPLIPCRRIVTCIGTLTSGTMWSTGLLAFLKGLVGRLLVRVRFLCHRVCKPGWPSHYGIVVVIIIAILFYYCKFVAESVHV